MQWRTEKWIGGGATTFSITTFSITTLSITKTNRNNQHSDIQHNVVMLNVTYKPLIAVCHYAECRMLSVVEVRVNQHLIFPQCPASALCFPCRASWRGAEICRRWAENGHVNLPLPVSWCLGGWLYGKVDGQMNIQRDRLLGRLTEW